MARRGFREGLLACCEHELPLPFPISSREVLLSALKVRKGSLSPGTYLIKGNDSLEDMAGNPSGSELLGACGKFVEGISEVPGDCCGRCHCL